MFLGGSVPPWAGGAEGDGSPPAANCGIRAVRPLRYSGLRQALREKKRKSLRNHEISVSSLQQIRPMIETVPLANAAEAYGRMMRNEARFRIVLGTGKELIGGALQRALLEG